MAENGYLRDIKHDLRNTVMRKTAHFLQEITLKKRDIEPFLFHHWKLIQQEYLPSFFGSQ